VLVIDEADKAPLEVVSILKGLVEDGRMALSDGRVILRDTGSASATATNIVPLHKDFKLIVLANR
jgi:MoxR-like ATPase